MTHIELNAVLYYADFLSLKHCGHPVTDNCKYFFIHGCPINSAFILDLEPEYDIENQYLSQAIAEFDVIKNKYDDEAAMSFIDDICSIKACGSVDAEQMLKCIHRFSNKHERKMAFNAYNEWLKNQNYFHITINEDGNPQQTKCTRYFKHAEKSLERRGILASTRFIRESLEKQAKKQSLSYRL